MEAAEFAEKLRRCAPDTKKLEAVGLSASEAHQFLLAFQCNRSTSSNVTNSAGDSLIDLVNLYDVSTVEIGPITLVQPIVEQDQFWLVGRDEVAYVVIDKASREVLVNELDTANSVTMRCAENGDSFLSALLPAACFLGRCSYDLELYQDEEAKASQAAECAELAGGNEYLDFYNYLLGAE